MSLTDGGDVSRSGPDDEAAEALNYNHQCYICDKTFSANSNLNRHLRKIHKENVQSPYNNVKCALCDSIYSSSSIYNQHLENDHRVNIEIERLTFANKKSFDEWKYNIEQETTSQYIKSRGEKKTKNLNKTYYSCNRSGYYVSKARTRKALKKQGSRKINGRCPASMNVTVNEDLSYDVRFVKTHVGHNFDVKHLDLSLKDRDLIVQKLEAGITKREIIKQLRSSIEHHATATASISPDSSVSANETGATINGDNIILSSTGHVPTSRLHLATTKDIHNIINSKNLDSKLIRHNYDLNNVDSWIDEMKEFNETSSVLLYKHQGEKDLRFPELREDDFMLVIMKEGQAEVFKACGDGCIIIDSTHNIHCEYLQVTHLSVIDRDAKGFPVAFLFSTRTDLDTLKVFFSLLKDKVGQMSTRTIIADELDDFYLAWTDIMSRPTHNLLAPWSVFESWSKKFELISNRDKLRKLKKLLRSLLTETEKEKFTVILEQIISDYHNDAETSEFMSYFEDKFAKNTDLWSSCFKKDHGTSNFQLWKLHDKFKLVYKEGKTSKKLCKFISGLMTLFEPQQLAYLAKLENIKSIKQKALEDRHKKSVETGSLVYEVAVEPVYWLCPSEISNEVYHEVRRDDDSPRSKGNRCCDLVCQSCNACLHEYKCTCLDYTVNLNMCNHIHRIRTMCQST